MVISPHAASVLSIRIRREQVDRHSGTIVRVACGGLTCKPFVGAQHVRDLSDAADVSSSRSSNEQVTGDARIQGEAPDRLEELTRQLLAP